MDTLTAGLATLILFGGQNLDGWIKLNGNWGVADESMVCQSAPAGIRSAFESDAYILSFRYRRSAGSEGRIYLHSKMTTGGVGLALTPAGLVPVDAAAPAAPSKSSAPDDEWIGVKIIMAADRLRASATRADGTTLNQVDLRLDAPDRGFVRFASKAPGLELREIVAAEPGFVSLFDGKSLDGWEIVRPKSLGDPGWVVKDGALQCRPQRSSWLRTLRTYDNFILRLEYQIPPRGNSGIFVRAPIEGRVSRIGLEIQLLDDVGYRGRFKPAQYTGSVYDGIIPEVSVPCPPDQWNAIEILLDGQRVRTILNSVQLYDDLLTDASKDTNADKRPLATRRLTGFIGLQDHSAPVKFRNIRIREIEGKRGE